MLNIDDPELLEQLERYIQVLLVVGQTCEELGCDRFAIATLAEQLNLSSNELVTALDARTHELLWQQLDNINGEFGSVTTLDVVERLSKSDMSFSTQLATWLKTKKEDAQESALHASADERGHGNDG